ncbi:MAG: hypothetical protein PF549_02360 [Patescibacteria group bacterium]|jgi:hypothetical protein|nr:hypothetical protein [Patescibacteria group bacterium]
MDKKKFYILLLAIVVIFMIGYVVIFLSGTPGFIKSNPEEKSFPDKEIEKIETDKYPKIKIISGEVISMEEDIIKIETNINGEKKIAELKLEGKIEKIYGSYENGGLIESKTEQVNFSDIAKGDALSAVITNSVNVNDLEKDVLGVENVIINPPGAPNF